MKDMEEIERLVGETPRASSIDDINAALEENMGAIFEKFNAQVEQRVKDVVNAAIEENMDSANVATNPNLSRQMSELKKR